MVFDMVLQTEINKKENRLYPFRRRNFRPNPSVPPVTGKFYASHDFPDPSLLDPEIENIILNKHILRPKDKYKDPLTVNMDYGWLPQTKPTTPSVYSFRYPKTSSWITQIGVMISVEDKKNPKKPFTGVAFKL